MNKLFEMYTLTSTINKNQLFYWLICTITEISMGDIDITECTEILTMTLQFDH